jgi:hypothetical protein
VVTKVVVDPNEGVRRRKPGQQHLDRCGGRRS